ELRKHSGHVCACRVVQITRFEIGVNIHAPNETDEGYNRRAAPDWPPIRLHVECSPSSQQRRFHTMPRSKKGSVNRRGFLKGAAAGAAALVTKPSITPAEAGPAGAAGQAARTATPTPLPGAALVAAETSPPPPRA